MEKVKLICGDAIEELKKIPDASVNLIATDPPYNLNKDYGNNKDKMGFDEYIEFSREWLSEAKRVLTEDGTLYVFMGTRYISYVYAILEQELKMTFNSWICWHYTQGLGKMRGLSSRHEDILMFTKHPQKFYFNLDAVRIPQKNYRAVNNMRGANPGNVWEVSHVHYCNQHRQNHPTQKPECLYERMVLASSKKGDVVLDPFLGSGTMLRVCQQTNRIGIGIDVNPEYIKLSEERLLEPFNGFDSIDARMKRVPDDLNDDTIRMEYIENHIKWFLKNHPNATKEFLKEVKAKYLDKMIKAEQTYIFTQYNVR